MVKREESRNQGRPPKGSGNSQSVARIENRSQINNTNARSQSKPAKETTSLKTKDEAPTLSKAIIPKKKETPSSKTDPPHKSFKVETPTNQKKPEDIKALDHKEPLKITEVRESKPQLREEPIEQMQKVPSQAKVKPVVAVEKSIPVENVVRNESSKREEEGEGQDDIEMEEEVPEGEGSYQEDFNDSLGGGGIEQSSKLIIKKREIQLSDIKQTEVQKIEEPAPKNDNE